MRTELLDTMQKGFFYIKGSDYTTFLTEYKPRLNRSVLDKVKFKSLLSFEEKWLAIASLSKLFEIKSLDLLEKHFLGVTDNLKNNKLFSKIVEDILLTFNSSFRIYIRKINEEFYSSEELLVMKDQLLEAGMVPGKNPNSWTYRKIKE